ncbi:MAG: AAA family ATPase [Phormidesmis sp. RL_2_1]|nr:AAA family ATPase [Phormidesmis sp. RL_2_1]
MTYYIAPSFLNKLAVHITKNYLKLPQIKVPLILGIHGRKGEGKTFQCNLVFQRMGVEVVHISGGELESPDAGDPARLIRLRYREAAELVRVRGCMAVLMINDLDAGAGRFDRMTQYTVNTQLVNNTLMNIADNPTNVQLPGSYDDKALPRIPIIATGNDFATLYAPLIRDGRMQKFYWEPNPAERLGMVSGMFASDGLSQQDVEKLVSCFDQQAIDFFGAVRSHIYDEQITHFIQSVGIENIASRVVNTLQLPTFTQPNFQIEHLIAVGKTLIKEQERVRTMNLVSEYNQALTPSRPLAQHPNSQQHHRNDPELLMPPAINPLKPYGLGKRDAQLAAQRSDNQTSENRAQNSVPQANGSTARSAASSIPATAPSRPLQPPTVTRNIQQLVHSILAQGHQLGIEHVDQRRFRMNSWQSYATLATPDETAATSKLKACLTQFPHDYIRLISIDRHTKRRINETIIQRP